MWKSTEKEWKRTKNLNRKNTRERIGKRGQYAAYRLRDSALLFDTPHAVRRGEEVHNSRFPSDSLV
jgi:hypothetical protein